MGDWLGRLRNALLVMAVVITPLYYGVLLAERDLATMRHLTERTRELEIALERDQTRDFSVSMVASHWTVSEHQITRHFVFVRDYRQRLSGALSGCDTRRASEPMLSTFDAPWFSNGLMSTRSWPRCRSGAQTP